MFEIRVKKSLGENVTLFEVQAERVARRHRAGQFVMSPEQVKGKSADQRSDIFAFGAILHEMLSGTRAFHRESAAETMTTVKPGLGR